MRGFAFSLVLALAPEDCPRAVAFALKHRHILRKQQSDIERCTVHERHAESGMEGKGDLALRFVPRQSRTRATPRAASLHDNELWRIYVAKMNRSAWFD